jgi:predicted ribosome quality control (RQC) complex YloA/Tae2 family protein
MVFYYTPIDAETTGHVIYVGKDKVENEDLIKYGLEHDVWFHVDKLSSAHVYLRLRCGETLDDITERELEDCAQLVKANSIAGNKQNDVGVVYTAWGNV